MSSWRLKGLKTLRSFAVSFLLIAIGSATLAAPPHKIMRLVEKKSDKRPGRSEMKEENHLGATVAISVTLEGITSYNDVLELKTGLLKSDGVDKVTLDTEAPGLITYTVRYAGEPKSLIEKLGGFFGKKYRIKEKGGSEISVSMP